jgi:hypothetical protein
MEVRHTLESDEVLAMNDDVPATHNQFSEPKDMSVSSKYTPDAKRVVLEGLPGPEDLWNLINGHRLRLANIFRPACKIFAYRKVRKKKFHTKTAAQRRTGNFRHFFDHPLPMLPRISSDCFPGISFNVWLVEGKFELVRSRVLRDKEEEMAIFFEKDGMELEMKKTSARIDLPTVSAPGIALSPRCAAERNDGPPLILSTIRKRVSPTIKQEHQTYDHLPITNSTAFMYNIESQETLATTNKHEFWCWKHEQSSNSWILLFIKVKVAFDPRSFKSPACSTERRHL